MNGIFSIFNASRHLLCLLFFLISCEKDKQELEKIIKTQQHIIHKMTEKIAELNLRLSQR